MNWTDLLWWDVSNTVNTCQLPSAELWHLANSKIRTKAVDKTLKTINESKSIEIHVKKHGLRGISRKWAFFTEDVTAVKSLMFGPYWLSVSGAAATFGSKNTCKSDLPKQQVRWTRHWIWPAKHHKSSWTHDDWPRLDSWNNTYTHAHAHRFNGLSLVHLGRPADP